MNVLPPVHPPTVRFWLLPRTVIVLSVVSTLNDFAGEMVAPLVPVFVTVTLGAGAWALGLIEGLADAVSNVLKVIAGRLADRGIGHKRLVVAGYGLANIARPLIGFAFVWTTVLVLRFADRIGKGLRTAPRDALIAGAVPVELRGRAFGFHRSMDHLGSAIGPLAAFLLLQAGLSSREIFFWSALPGLFAILLLVYGVPETHPVSAARLAPTPAVPLFGWPLLDRRARRLIVAAGIVGFASLPDAFLLLWAAASGMSLGDVALIWAAAGLVRALVAAPAGRLSDSVGRYAVVIGGWSIRAVLLALLAVDAGAWIGVWPLFLTYAGASVLTEAAERALVGDVADPSQRATVFGLYYVVSGLMTLPGAVLFGLAWQFLGMTAALGIAAALTFAATAALLQALRDGPGRPSGR